MSREYQYEEEDFADATIVDELLNGLNDWRSVPDIVRLTFKALSDIIKSHTASLRDLEIQITTKANRSELIQKVNHSDLQRLLSETRSTGEANNIETFQSLLEEKLTRKECTYMINGKFNELKSELDKKSDLRELQNEVRAVKSMIEDSSGKKSQVKEIETVFKLLEQKANISEVNAALDDKVSKQVFANSLSKKVNRNDLEALLLGKADMGELQSILAIIDNKADRHTVDGLAQGSTGKLDKLEVLKLIREEISKKLELNDTGDSVNRIKRELDYKLNHFDKYIESLRVNIEQTQTTLAEEIANKGTGGDIEIRTEITRFTTSVKSEIRKLEDRYNERISKLDLSIKSVFDEISEFRAKLKNFKDEDSPGNQGVESVRQELRMTVIKDYDKIVKDVAGIKLGLENYVESRFKELRSLLDGKSDRYEFEALKSEQKFTRGYSDDLEHTKRVFESMQKKGFSEVYELLDALRTDLLSKASHQDLLSGLSSKASLEDIQNLALSDDKMIIEALCSENCTGRWLWKSGEVRAGLTVPWEIQSVNTCPENFIWEKDSTSLIAMTPGLYEVFFGFFAGKKPQIQLLVNGEAVIIDTQVEGKVLGRHRDGNIVGAALTDYVALPARARITMTYTGPRIVEGFISLRKL